MKHAAITAALLALSSAAHAQQNCAGFNDANEFVLQQIALETADGIGDSSAPRAALRAQRVSNLLTEMQINLRLMDASKCALPTSPLNTSAYLVPALECATARVKGERNSPSCEFKNWKRGGPDKPAPASFDSWRK